MKRKPISILQTALAITAVSAFAFAATVDAQTGNTSTSDNPHLRKRDEPAKQQAAVKELNAKDKDFIQKAANAGVGLVADGKVAEARGSEKVKQIGSRLVGDHSQANKELEELAKKKGLAMDLSKGKPRNFPKEGFDDQYLLNVKPDIEGDIKAFQEEAKSGVDSELKGWAGSKLPMLKSELSMVKGAHK